MTGARFPEWWSPKALAHGLGVSTQSINAKAVREGWREALTLDGRSMCRSAAGRGKGYEYRIGVLSQAQQEQLRLPYQKELMEPAWGVGEQRIYSV